GEPRPDGGKYWDKRRVQTSLRRLLESIQDWSEKRQEQLTRQGADAPSGDLAGEVLCGIWQATPGQGLGTLDPEKIKMTEQDFITGVQLLGAWPPELTPGDRQEVFAALLVPTQRSIRHLKEGRANLSQVLNLRSLREGLSGIPYVLPDFPVPVHLLQGSKSASWKISEIAKELATRFAADGTGADMVKDFYLSGLLSLEELQIALPELVEIRKLEQAVELILRTSSRCLTAAEWQKFVYSVRGEHPGAKEEEATPKPPAEADTDPGPDSGPQPGQKHFLEELGVRQALRLLLPRQIPESARPAECGHHRRTVANAISALLPARAVELLEPEAGSFLLDHLPPGIESLSHLQIHEHNGGEYTKLGSAGPGSGDVREQYRLLTASGDSEQAEKTVCVDEAAMSDSVDKACGQAQMSEPVQKACGQLQAEAATDDSGKEESAEAEPGATLPGPSHRGRGKAAEAGLGCQDLGPAARAWPGSRRRPRAVTEFVGLQTHVGDAAATEEDEVGDGEQGESVMQLLERIRSRPSEAEMQDGGNTDKSEVEYVVDGNSKPRTETAVMREASLAVATAKTQDAEEQLRKVLPAADRITLAGALRDHDSFDAAKDAVFRLVCYLRMGASGCDARYMKDHFTARVHSLDKSVSWQNKLRHELAQQEALDKVLAARKSRQEAWMELADKQYSGVAKCLPRSCTLGTGQVVIVSLSDGSPEPALVMSVFRANKKCASSLCFDENPRGSTVAVRAVLLSKSERRELPVASFSGTLTGYQCQLTQSSQDVLQDLLAETSVTIPKPVKKGQTKHIVSLTVEKLRRNDQGRECFRQEFQRLLRVDAELFAGSKPIVDSGTQLIQTKRAAKETEAVYMQSLVDKVAYYMQACFVQHRNPVQYGAKVYGELIVDWSTTGGRRHSHQA
ncbi:TRO, partial [Symbiodinium microadriaticum]